MTSTRPFRFGLQVSRSVGQGVAGQARQAEELGYSTFTADHDFGPGGAPTPPEPSGRRGRDRRHDGGRGVRHLSVGGRVFCVDYRKPNVLAKELATIAFFAEGRLEMGLGAGWVAGEYDGLGIPMDGPGSASSAWRRRWGSSARTGPANRWTSTGSTSTPRASRRPVPVQTPPPIMIGGGAPRVLRTAGRLADIVSLNFNNASGTLGSASVVSATLEKTQEKIGWIREGAGDRFDDSSSRSPRTSPR